VGGVEHEVVARGGDFFVDAAQDLPDIAGVELGHEQADHLMPAAGQGACLAIDGVSGAGHCLEHALAGRRADIPLAIDDPGHRRVGDVGLPRDVDDGGALVIATWHPGFLWVDRQKPDNACRYDGAFMPQYTGYGPPKNASVCR
jgi:hypothetical protein